MFRFDMEINAWVPLNYEATYTQPVTVHGDSLDEFPDGAEVTPIQLNEEQAARLNAVRGDTTITLEDLMAYVLDGAEVHQKSTYDKQVAMTSVIEQLPEEVIENNIDALSDSFPPWRKNVPYKAGAHVTHHGMLYKVRQAHTSLEHQPPDAEGMLAIYLPYNPPGTIVDYDPDRNLSANPYQVGELVRFPYGVYECVRTTNFSPEEYAPDWIKREDLT